MWTEVDCTSACTRIYNDQGGNKLVVEVGSCTLEPPENLDRRSPGHLQCAGRAEDVCEGRRPLQHEESLGQGGDPLGRDLASMAYLESASVLAFEELATWLEGQGAPRSLVRRCKSAAQDERHHAKWLTALAAARGARVPTPGHHDASQASAYEVASHNAVEGCVHESYAALVASARSRRAPDPTIRRVFARIAEDETRHGQLAWDLHAWLQPLLTEAEVRDVRARQHAALAGLPARARRAQQSLAIELAPMDTDTAHAVAEAFAEHLAASSPRRDRGPKRRPATRRRGTCRQPAGRSRRLHRGIRRRPSAARG